MKLSKEMRSTLTWLSEVQGRRLSVAEGFIGFAWVGTYMVEPDGSRIRNKDDSPCLRFRALGKGLREGWLIEAGKKATFRITDKGRRVLLQTGTP